MPRKPPAPPKVNSLIASAATLTQQRMRRPKSGVQEWQQQAWYFFDTIGEFRFGATWKAQAVSRARLVITEDGPDGEKTVDQGPEVEVLQALFGGDAGQSQMLANIGLHLEVPGETYIVGEVVTDGDAEDAEEVDRWTIYSNEELTRGQGAASPWRVDRGDGKSRNLADDSVVIRLWRSHPRKWVEPDSPARAVLPVLRELEQLTKHVAASVDSRLAGAGLLLLPSEMTFGADPAPTSITDPNSPQGAVADPFIATLAEAMVTPIADRGNANAVVPVVVRAPGALIGNAKHITFATPLDEKAMELRNEGIRRLALGMDLPPEVLLGLSDSNHWSAWQIDESALKMHVEPLLEVITAGLTERWLRPAVEALGATYNPARRINFDTSDLRLRPDRSSEALQLYDRLELSGKTLRRETGFEDGDAPKGEDLLSALLRKAAQGALTPDITLAALQALGAGLDPQPVDGSDDGQPALPPAPEPDPETERDLPVDEASLMAAAELLVGRAVERANNRVNRRAKTRRPIPADQLDAALVDAWTTVPRCSALLGVDPDRFVAALDKYTRAVLVEGVDHSPQVLRQVLRQVRGG